MDTGRLPAETRQLWLALMHEPLLRGFVLIGGTALTLRIGHRLSEDLDFAYLGVTLPTQRLALLKKVLSTKGIRLEPIQDSVAQNAFMDAGLDLADYQQNYLAHLPQGAVKLSFVCFDPHVTALLGGNDASMLRVATLDEAFKTKVLAAADRSKTRDWFDLYVLMSRHGYDGEDFYRVFVEAGREGVFDIANMRLRSGKPSLTDEGYVNLLDDPPSLQMMQNFFVAMLDQLEVDLSKAAFMARKRMSNDDSGN